MFQFYVNIKKIDCGIHAFIFILIMTTFQETLDFCKKNYTLTANSRRYKTTDEVIKELKMEPKFEKTTVEVVNSDSFDYARTLKSDKVMVLNLANDTYAGSTVATSISGQEQTLYLCSNLPYRREVKTDPFDENEVIYTDNVDIIRSFKEGKRFLKPEERKIVSVIACAAICGPHLSKDKNDFKYEEDRELTRLKIDMIFQTAYLEGCDSLVMGSLGCGIFSGPSVAIAKLFDEANKKYNGCFAHIGYAVLNDHRNNYYIFKDNIEERQ